MANTFDEQAKDRFQKSLAFMRKAEALLQDDLIYRSALADAVSAIKNMLQGYLLYKVAHMPTSAVTQRWQEIANGNRMPELIATCGEAGLDLRGLAVEIKQLNTERNNRTHDDPQQTIDPKQAERAVEIARDLQKRIRAANEGKADARSISQRAAEVVGVVRGAVSGQLKLPATATVAAAATATTATRTQSAGGESSSRGASAVATATGTAPQTLDMPAPSTPESATRAGGSSATPRREDTRAAEPPTEDTTADVMRALDDTNDAADGDDYGGKRSRRRARRGRMILWRSLAIAALLLVGIAGGVGVAIPLAHGRAPGWLGFTKGWFTASTPTVAVSPTATEPALSGATRIGEVAISAPACASGVVSVTLTNEGTTTATWATGSPDADSATFGTSATAATQPTLTGTLAAGKQVTLYAAGPTPGTVYHLSIVASGGAVQLLVRSC